VFQIFLLLVVRKKALIVKAKGSRRTTPTIIAKVKGSCCAISTIITQRSPGVDYIP
jgi:hypothetical protein